MTEERKAWVISVDMGYGHQRAAAPFRRLAEERILTANNDAIISADERRSVDAMPVDAETFRRQAGLVPGAELLGPPNPFVANWRLPSLAINAIQASSRRDGILAYRNYLICRTSKGKQNRIK